MAKTTRKKRSTSGKKPSGEMTFMGLPFRGRVPTIHSNEAQEQPKLDYEVHTKIFDLTDSRQVEEYRKICEQLVQNKAMLIESHTMEVKETGILKKFITWAVKYYRAMTPSEKRDFMGMYSI